VPLQPPSTTDHDAPARAGRGAADALPKVKAATGAGAPRTVAMTTGRCSVTSLNLVPMPRGSRGRPTAACSLPPTLRHLTQARSCESKALYYAAYALAEPATIYRAPKPKLSSSWPPLTMKLTRGPAAGGAVGFSGLLGKRYEL